MKLRRFQAKDMSEALKIIKDELGEDAIILDTQKRYKLDPFTGKKLSCVEVVAAVDEKEESPLFERAKRPTIEQSAIGDILNEIKSLKDEIYRLTKIINNSSLDFNEKRYQKTETLNLNNIQVLLSALHLDRHSELKLIRSLYPKGIKRADKFPLRLRQYISSNLKLGPSAERLKGRCWWAVVGPTGVGKTTTLAKIAARLKFLCGKSGVLISVDGYRLGAIEQLQRFASLMELPLETAQTNKELLKLFSKNREKDFILVDTTGRNPYSSFHKTELQRLFDSVPGLMAQVMLSATSKREDLIESIGFYKRFPVAGWTLTKIDETKSLATALLPIIESELPLSYVTNGQKVPEDIMIPKAIELANMVIAPLVMKENSKVNIETKVRDFNAVV